MSKTKTKGKKTRTKSTPKPSQEMMPEGVTREDCKRDPATLIPYANNARIHTPEQVRDIATSMQEWGFTNPILIDENNEIIAGHGRQQAALILGIELVPCVELSGLSAQQKKALVLADNKLAENAGWNLQLLAVELTQLKNEEFDLSVIGFSTAELDRLMGVTDTTGDTDDDHVPDPPTVPISAEGDIWICGRHRVMCGNSTSPGDVGRLMAGQQAELLFTSPPYSDMRDYNGEKDLTVDNLALFISAYSSSCKYQAVNLGIQIKDREVNQYWQAYFDVAAESGLKLLAWNVWHKPTGGSIAAATAMFLLQHEWIFVFGKDFKRLNRTQENKAQDNLQEHGLKKKVRQKSGEMGSTTTKQYTHHQLESVVSINPETGAAKIGHPAVFPVALPESYILAMTAQTDLVVDCFGGGGSTLIACEKTGRRGNLMELDPAFCDLIVKRWQDYSGQEAHSEMTNYSFETVGIQRGVTDE